MPELVNAAPRRQSNQASREIGAPKDAMSELEKLKAELAAAKSRIGQLEAEKSHPGSETNTPVRTTQPEHLATNQPAPQQMQHSQHPAANQPAPQQMQHSHYQPSQPYATPNHPAYTPMNRPVHGQGVPQPTQSPVNQQLHTPTSGMGTGPDPSDPYGRDLRWAPFFGYPPANNMTPQPQPQPQPEHWGHGGRNSGIYRNPLN